MLSSCLECKPCNGMHAHFERISIGMAMPGALRRAFRRMNPGVGRRRRHSSSFSSVRAVFWPLMSMHSDERTDGPPSSTDSRGRAPPPSLDTPAAPTPATGAMVLALQAQLGEAAAARKAGCGRGVEEACRSFEKQLARMVVEEGKVRELMDVEELLRCWEQLKCPVFVELVGRFYGELCMDLFCQG